MSKETAKQIRDLLKKELKVTNKQVSVKSPHYSSVVVTVKDLSVDFNKVKDIAESFEVIRRCEASQEILCGGNTFIDVRLDSDALDKASEEYLTFAEKCFHNFGDFENKVIFGNERYEVALSKSDYGYFDIILYDCNMRKYARQVRSHEAVARFFAEVDALFEVKILPQISNKFK